MSADSVFDGSSGLLDIETQDVLPPAFSGVWCSLDLQPDVFSPQVFTVGVVVQPSDDRLHFKLLDDFKKFECVYGERLSKKVLKELLAYAEQTLRGAAMARAPVSEIQFETASLRISGPYYTSGDSFEATVERLYSEIVVMAPESRKKPNDFDSIDTVRARELVNKELKRIAKLDFERIVNPSGYGMSVEENGVKHFLDLNLVTPGACGSVTSAVYKTPQTVELNMLKSSRDLTTYSRIKRLEDIGLFLLLPEEGALTDKEFRKIDEVISEYEWKLEQDGFRVVSLSSPADLASEIYQWARPTLV